LHQAIGETNLRFNASKPDGDRRRNYPHRRAIWCGVSLCG